MHAMLFFVAGVALTAEVARDESDRDAAAPCRAMLAGSGRSSHGARWSDMGCDGLMLRGRGSAVQVLVDDAETAGRRNRPNADACHQLLQRADGSALIALEDSAEWRDYGCATAMLEGAPSEARVLVPEERRGLRPALASRPEGGPDLVYGIP